MRHLTTILLLFFTLISAAQNEDLFPDVAWRTNVADVTVVNDSTYQFKVMPQDINEPGAGAMDYGNYFIDYIGHIYEVVDSAYLSVTVEDVFDYGVSPQRDRIGVMYNSAYYGLSPYLSTISFRYLHSLARDNVRKIENAVLWKEASLYAKDSANLVWWKDTITDISTRYDIDTLHQKTIDSILIHRNEIDELKNQSDSLSSTLPDWATSVDAQAGVKEDVMMNPARTAEQITLNQIPYYGAKEDLYSEYNAEFDTLKSIALKGNGIRSVAVNDSGVLIDTTLISDTEIQMLIDSLNYYLLITDFNDSMIVLRSEIPTLLTQLDSTGFTLKEAQISDLQPYLLESDLQPLKDTIQINSDSIDVLANLIADIETITELATILEAQSGVSDKLMTALRTAEQITLNAVPYYNVKEDIYSNFDATFDSIFASNLYQENISTTPTGTGGVYDKEVSTNNVEVYLNGVLQRENVNYTQTETQITFIKAPLATDYITIKYK